VEKKVTRITKLSTVIACALLGGCSNLPGNYFDLSQATAKVITQNKAFKPKIVPINSTLYADTITYSEKHPTQSLWYTSKYAYHVGDEDILNVIVWDHPELSSPQDALSGAMPSDTTSFNITPINASQPATLTGTLINASGNIYFPYAGSVHVAGLTTNQVGSLIAKRLSNKIRDPQVSIRVADYRSKRINVMGEVNRPQPVSMGDIPLTIMDAINSAGGINKLTADTSKIFIIRGQANDPQLFILNAHSPSNLLVARNFKLYPNDIIYVPTTKLTNWNKTISNLLPTLQTSAVTKSLVK
jgi:polysaccharide biosynthesis/export protein